MPAVIAYQCPRTKTLFAEKTEYLDYLRREARNSLTLKSHAKVRAPLKAAYAQLRSTAQSSQDICNWLKNQHTLLLNTMSKLNGIVVTPRHRGITSAQMSYYALAGVGYEPQNIDAYIQQASLSVTGHPCLNLAFLFKDVGMFDVRPIKGNNDSSRDKQYNITLLAKDWPFIAATMLYQWVSSNVKEGLCTQRRTIMKELLTLHFPGCSYTKLEVGYAAGLLPETQSELISWLFTQRTAPEPTAEHMQLQSGLEFISP